MNNFNPNIHHRKSIRLKGYDYSQAGLYFITICCQDKRCLFGDITIEMENLSSQNPSNFSIKIIDKNTSENWPIPKSESKTNKMKLNDAGKIAQACWLAIPNHFPNVVLHGYIVMPNHIHGIIELIYSANVVGVENFQPLPSPSQLQNEFQKIIPQSIGSIVRGFKIGVTKWMRQNTDVNMVWQRNYHEHIIRNEQSYLRISNYILNNPANWKGDVFYNE
jgi:putative transposase